MDASNMIAKALKKANKSVYWLASETGIGTSTLYAVLNKQNRTLGLEKMVKVAIALDIDLNSLKEIYGEKNEEQANAELAVLSLAGTSVQGSDVEADNRVQSDRFLLNTIESEREERMEATRDTINTLTTLGTNDFVFWKELRKHEIVLSVVIGVEIGLLIAMMLIVWQTLN